MKCISCGGEVGSDQERCPYCNAVNKEAILNRTQIDVKKLRNEELKGHVLESSEVYIWSRILNRSIVILAVIFCLMAGVSFIAYMSAAGELKKKPRDIVRQLDNYYQQREINRLGSLMTRYNLMGQDYYKYSQITLLQGEYEIFLFNRNKCMEQLEEDSIQDDTIEHTLKYGLEILSPDLPAYREIDGENQEILKEYQMMVMTFFKTCLKLKEDEISDLCRQKDSGYLPLSAMEETMKKVSERLGE